MKPALEKELVARAVHDESLRKHRPYVILNCSALPSGLVESELFGHERGAFTTVSRTEGRFQQVHGGTLFRDEICELRLELQPQLLSVLQEQECERLGSGRTTRVDVRVIAAINADRRQMVLEHRFRADLFYLRNPITKSSSKVIAPTQYGRTGSGFWQAWTR